MSLNCCPTCHNSSSRMCSSCKWPLVTYIECKSKEYRWLTANGEQLCWKMTGGMSPFSTTSKNWSIWKDLCTRYIQIKQNTPLWSRGQSCYYAWARYYICEATFISTHSVSSDTGHKDPQGQYWSHYLVTHFQKAREEVPLRCVRDPWPPETPLHPWLHISYTAGATEKGKLCLLKMSFVFLCRIKHPDWPSGVRSIFNTLKWRPHLAAAPCTSLLRQSLFYLRRWFLSHFHKDWTAVEVPRFPTCQTKVLLFSRRSIFWDPKGSTTPWGSPCFSSAWDASRGLRSQVRQSRELRKIIMSVTSVKATFQVCPVRDTCAAHSSLCVHVHWRSQCQGMFLASRKFTCFPGSCFDRGLWITGFFEGWDRCRLSR